MIFIIDGKNLKTSPKDYKLKEILILIINLFKLKIIYFNIYIYD